MDDLISKQAIESLAAMGINCEQLQKDLIKLASMMALTFSEVINAIQLALSRSEDYFKKIEYTPKKQYKRTMDIKPTQRLIINRKTNLYYHRGSR